ncbi:MAG TPA: GrpB family protein, partial [Gaiellaceae bacterium]|nr:GrpB family protein [Gaiellaceae bacterium]
MVVISPYRDDWPAAFEVVARRLAAILGERALRIDHVGSTAGPGLDAKNVIDVQVTVRALTDADPLAEARYRVLPVVDDHVPPG